MTYELERQAIETYFRNSYTGSASIGVHGKPFKPTANSILVQINKGSAMNKSIGRSVDCVAYVGVVQCVIYTDSEAGTKTANDIAEDICSIFRNKVLDNTGALSIAPDTAFIQFSPPTGRSGSQHPHISGEADQIPYKLTTVNAPFVRYSYH